jgi:hypothetical protein
MCAKCAEIDRRIQHLKELASRLLDAPALDGIAALIAELEAQKRALHPERTAPSSSEKD